MRLLSRCYYFIFFLHSIRFNNENNIKYSCAYKRRVFVYMRVHEIMINIGWKCVHEKILVSVFGIRRSRSLPDSVVSCMRRFVVSFFFVRLLLRVFPSSVLAVIPQDDGRYTRVLQVYVLSILLLLLLLLFARCCRSFVVEFSTGNTIINIIYRY